jgi:uncharacterized protein (TIGR02118 family)
MIKVSVFYPGGPQHTFNMAYYIGTHIPMLRQRLGQLLKGVAVDQGIAGGTPGSPPTYLAICHLFFESVDAFQIGFTTHGDAIIADVPNYTNASPTLQISDIKLM